MAKMMAIALPVAAIAGAAFTGGTSLGLLGADAAVEAGGAATIDAATGAAISGGADAAASSSWLGSTIAAVSPYAKLAGAGASILGTVTSAVGAKQSGDQSKDLADFEANQLKANANTEAAAGEEKMQQQNRATAYALSNAQASAAASGGSATDPTVNNVMKTIAGEGRFRALQDLYQGNSAAQLDNTKANAQIYSGKNAEEAGNTKMYSNILSGASSLFSKYASFNDDGTIV